MKLSNLSKYVRDNIDRTCYWSVLARASTYTFQWKVLEAYYIVLEKATLNDQFKSDRLSVFINGVTCFMCFMF